VGAKLRDLEAVADAEQLECLPLESGRSGGEPEAGRQGHQHQRPAGKPKPLTS
jgi:hypothetical protein